MNPALLIRLRPTTPWRIGPDTGARDQASAILHSDALYSAVCLAFEQLGLLEEWLGATAKPFGEPAVRFSSCFPWQRGFLYAPPPARLWPPVEGPTPRVRWKGATLLPTSVIAGLLRGETPTEDQWTVDGHSGCLIPLNSRSASGPFRLLRRSSAAVDRVTGGLAEPHLTTCVQFAPASGLWCAAQFSNPSTYAVWAPKLQAAFRLLADSGLGGLRSRGFGRSRTPDFQAGELTHLLFGGDAAPAAKNAWWLLSLYSPADGDAVDWSSGDYRLVERAGRTGAYRSPGREKLHSRMVAEGSVLAGDALRGAVRNVAPEGSPHPIYRAGYALAISIPWPVNA
ncbi:MAG: hypothetical protein HZB13_00520 [Acidobacteria bacterium]|nr:hypothetical protein [Acidobacteriota bacterium]